MKSKKEKARACAGFASMIMCTCRNELIHTLYTCISIFHVCFKHPKSRQGLSHMICVCHGDIELKTILHANNNRWRSSLKTCANGSIQASIHAMISMNSHAVTGPRRMAQRLLRILHLTPCRYVRACACEWPHLLAGFVYMLGDLFHMVFHAIVEGNSHKCNLCKRRQSFMYAHTVDTCSCSYLCTHS